MLRRIFLILASLIFAFSVLGTSILRTTQPDYVFSQTGQVAGTQTASVAGSIDYYLPYPGILPDHFLWPLKAARDRVWLFLTRDTMKRAELYLLFADKRVGMAEALIRGGKPELGVSTAAKGEMYLEDALLQAETAREKDVDTASFLQKLARSSLKHIEILESVMVSAPEDAKPVINQILDSPRKVYEKTVQGLNEKGIEPPALVPQN